MNSAPIPSAIECHRWPWIQVCAAARRSAHHTRKEPGDFGLLLFVFLLLFFLDAILAIDSKSLVYRHYFALVQRLRQNNQYNRLKQLQDA